jgi:hypothetical protein
MAEEEPVAESVAVRPESHQIGITSEASPNKQEIERRREIVRQVFNDFWMSTDDKSRTFAERLNRAEDHINERLRAERHGGLTPRLGNSFASRIDLPQTTVCGHGHGDRDEVGPRSCLKPGG